MAKMQFTKYNITTFGVSIVAMLVLVFTTLLIVHDNQPQSIDTHAQTIATPPQNSPMIPTVMHTLPCQFYLLAGGTFSQGDSLYCVNIIKTLLDGVHAYDSKNQAGWWPSIWDEPYNDSGYGQRTTNAVNQFQSTTQTTAMIRVLPWTWPINNLEKNGNVNLNTYKDLCTEAVAVGVSGADVDCSLFTPTPTPICTPKPAITCPVNGPCTTPTPPPGGWCPNPTPICIPRPTIVCPKGAICAVPNLPAGQVYCPITPTPTCTPRVAITCAVGHICPTPTTPSGGWCQTIPTPTCTPKPVCKPGQACPNIIPNGGWCPFPTAQPLNGNGVGL